MFYCSIDYLKFFNFITFSINIYTVMNSFCILLQLYIPKYINQRTFSDIILYIFTICILLEKFHYSPGNQLCAFPRMERVSFPSTSSPSSWWQRDHQQTLSTWWRQDNMELSGNKGQFTSHILANGSEEEGKTF